MLTMSIAIAVVEHIGKQAALQLCGLKAVKHQRKVSRNIRVQSNLIIESFLSIACQKTLEGGCCRYMKMNIWRKAIQFW